MDTLTSLINNTDPLLLYAIGAVVLVFVVLLLQDMMTLIIIGLIGAALYFAWLFIIDSDLPNNLPTPQLELPNDSDDLKSRDQESQSDANKEAPLFDLPPLSL